MKFKVRVCTILAVTCILALQGIVSAAEEGDSKMEYSSTILEEGYTMEIAEEQKIMRLSANTSFNWTVKPKKIKASSGFKKKAGSVIRFHVNVSPKKNPTFKVKRLSQYGAEVNISDKNVIAHFATINY